MKITSIIASFSFIITLASCNSANDNKGSDKTTPSENTAAIKEEAVTINSGNAALKSFIYYDSTTNKKRPAVLVVHEWWGLTDYTKMRARQLAQMGYIAMAVDMYGNGQVAADPGQAKALATPFYMDPQLSATRINDAINELKKRSQTDGNNIAAIGYCFGGTVVLNSARLGDDLKAVVSFHGDMPEGAIDKSKWKGAVLICHGAADQFVPQAKVDSFKHVLDSLGIDNTLKVYANATHAFTNPSTTATGEKFHMPVKYNGPADTASWNDMKAFFGRILK